MACAVTRAMATRILGANEYIESASFPIGKLPTNKNVLESMLYLLRPARAGQTQLTKVQAASTLAGTIQDHWLFCNIYTKTKNKITTQIVGLYDRFQNLYQVRKGRVTDAYLTRVGEFNSESLKLFDVFCTDDAVRKDLERSHGVVMGKMEWDFLRGWGGTRW